MLFLLVVMVGCSNYDTYIETGMQSLKDEKYSDATMWFEKAEKEKSGNEAKSYKEMAEKMDHGATALKDGKYLEAKDIANEVLQMKKDDELEKSCNIKCREYASKSKKMWKRK